MKRFSWRWLPLAAFPACVLVQPLDKAAPDSSGTSSGGQSEAGSAGKHTGSAGSGTHGGGAPAAAGASGEAGAVEPAGGSAPNGGTTGAPSGGTGGKPSGGSSGRPSGGSTGAPSGGTAGATAPSGGSAGTTSTTCKVPGGVCTQRSDCCQSGADIPTANGATCDASDHLCHANCTDGALCNSGCCLPVAGTNYGTCEVSTQCGCLPEGTTCNAQATNKCCGGSVAVCYAGDSECHRVCFVDGDCPSNCCDTSVDLCAPTTSCGR